MTEYPYFPLFVNLSGKKILIVGAGSIALRRAETLAPFGAELIVTAPEGRPEMGNSGGGLEPPPVSGRGFGRGCSGSCSYR